MAGDQADKLKKLAAEGEANWKNRRKVDDGHFVSRDVASSVFINKT